MMKPGKYKSLSFHQSNERGLALIGAIAMMALFVLLGTAYVRYMSLEVASTRADLERGRVHQLAVSGIYAAIGEIEHALDVGDAPDAAYNFDINVYRYVQSKREAHPQSVAVTVSDEASRININHAPDAVLKALGLDEKAITKLFRALPSRSADDTRTWLSSPDDLRTREILNAQAYEALDRSILTTYTVQNHATPEGFINLNTASPKVLSAVFAIEPGEAEQLASKRPFTSWRDVVTKTGREQSTFNISNSEYASREMPSELALSSRCFRVASEAKLQYEDSARRPISSAIEAVVMFHPNGKYSIRYWNERPDEITQGPSPEPVPQVPATQEPETATEPSSDPEPEPQTTTP